MAHYLLFLLFEALLFTLKGLEIVVFFPLRESLLPRILDLLVACFRVAGVLI